MNERLREAVVLLTVLAVGVIALVFISKLPTALEEGNLLKILAAIVKLELTEVNIVKFSGDPERYVFKAGHGTESLSSYLGENGWQLRNQLGATVSYKKNREILSGSLRMFTRRFMVFEVRRQGDCYQLCMENCTSKLPPSYDKDMCHWDCVVAICD